jgi:hypothetical protein
MLAHKAIKTGYYWPSMNEDSMRIVQNCNKFLVVEQLSSVSAPKSFARNGGRHHWPLPLGKGGCKFLVVAVDYFTKWAEVEALVTITTGNVRNFL